MNKDCPKTLQIEVTNECNFNCQMCIRRVWNAKPENLNLDLYKKIVEAISQCLDKLILYGLGEPLLNPNFLNMLKIARRKLPKDCEISLSTNGSLLDQKLAERILRIGIDDISFSIDTSDLTKLKYIREGSEPTKLIKNFRYLARMKRLNRDLFKLGIEAVVMKDNFMDLPGLVVDAANEGVDYVLVSHVVPYTERIFQNAVYITLSRRSFEIIQSALNYGQKIMLEAVYETFGRAYGINIESRASNIVRGFWSEAEKDGYWINLPLLFESIDKIAVIHDVERIFILSQKLAHEYEVELRLPNLYPDAKDRSCPYVDKEIMFVRSDGAVTPCIEFSYKHPVYINSHVKTVNPVILGDLNEENVGDVWNKENYLAFREIRRKMSKNIPWCGDCLYSSLRCFFAETNSIDCYVNEPSCSECLYSVKIAQCNV